MVVGVYLNALTGPFILDDITSVVPARIDIFSFSELWQITFGNNSGPLGRPVTILTFAINNYFGGDAPYTYKIVNLAIHCLNFLLIYWFTSLLLSSLISAKTDYSKSEITILSLCCSAIWALHPMQVSTVMYVVQRMAMLSTMFSLCTLIVYLKYRKSNLNPVQRIAWTSSLALLILISSFSKENGILTILYLGLLELLLVAKSANWLACFLKKYKYIVGATFVVATAAILYIVSYKLVGYTVREHSLLERAITQPEVLVFYLSNIVFPDIDAMSVFHDGYPVRTEINFVVTFSLLLLISLFVLMLYSKKRDSAVCFGIGLFFLSHVLESTILPLEHIFEHRNYLAIHGIFLAIFVGTFNITKKFDINRNFLAVAFSLILILYTPQTYFRSIEWSSTPALLSAGQQNKPDSIRAKTNVSFHLRAENKLSELRSHLDFSAEQHPNQALFSIHRLMFSNVADDSLIEDAVTQLSTNPIRASDVIALRDLYTFKLNSDVDWPTFTHIEKLYAVATRNKDKKVKTRTIAIFFGYYSDILMHTGKYDEAKKAITQSISLLPDNFELSSRLVNILMIEGDKDEAIKVVESMKSSMHKKSVAEINQILALEGRVLSELTE